MSEKTTTKIPKKEIPYNSFSGNQILQTIFSLPEMEILFEKMSKEQSKEAMAFLVGLCHELNEDVIKFKENLTPDIAKKIMKEVKKDVK